MSSVPLRNLLAMPDGSLMKDQWTNQILQFLHGVLANLPAPEAGEGNFSKWRNATFMPACTGQAAVLKKFTPQTLKPKVLQFYNRSEEDLSTLPRIPVSSTPAKRNAADALLDLANKPKPSSNSGGPISTGLLRKKARTAAAIVDIGQEDDLHIDLVEKDVNRSGDVPHMTTTFTNDAGKKHFVLIGMQVPRCDEVAPIITVTDRTVTVEVPSVKCSADDANQIVNFLKGHAELSDETATHVSNRIMKTVQQVKPWRYEITAPFKLNPNDVKTFVKQLRVGSLTSKSTHDVIIVDVGEYQPVTTNAVLYVDNIGFGQSRVQ